MKNIEQTITNLKYAIAHPSSIRLDQLDSETMDQLLSIINRLIQPKEKENETEC
jgi:hypothetical protein